MRSRGLNDLYWKTLPEDYHDAMRNLIVRSWVPIDIAVAHYTALDNLGLTHAEMVENGAMVANRAQATYVGTIMRGLRATKSLTVWNVFKRMDTAWGRLMQGGAPVVYQLGPKEALLELHAVSLLNIAYFRAGLEGVTLGTLELITRKAYVRQLKQRAAGMAAYRISWV